MSWCDADADPATVGDPAAADRIAAELRFEGLLRSVLRAERPAAAPARRRWPFAAAAAATLLLGAGWWLLRPDGRVRVDGVACDPGAVIAATAPRTVAWADGSRVRLAAGAEAVLGAAGAPALELRSGRLQAEIAPRPAPFVIAGAGCTAEVLGTVFALDRGAAGMLLQVERGRVRLAGPAGAVVAAAGEAAWADAGQEPLHEVAAGAGIWRPATVAVGTAGGRGGPFRAETWRAEAGAAPRAVFGIEARGARLFAWDGRARLRFAWRCDGAVPWAGIWLQAPPGAGSNRYLALPSPRPGVWGNVDVALEAIPPLTAGLAPPPPGAAVRWLHVQAGWAPGATLTVSGLRLEAGR